MTRARRLTALLATALIAVGLAACTPDGEAPPAPTVAPTSPVRVTLAVYGPDPVISAYATIAARFQSANPGITVNIKPYRDHDTAMAALAKTSGTDHGPDIFLASRDDLAALMRTKANQRVDQMLSSRNVDFGDSYERPALEAFSAKSALQCMPVSISPLVVYYNRALVDLSTLRAGTVRQPSPEDGWRFSDFAAAATQAATTSKHKGVYLAPQVDQIAPFVASAGGRLVDDNSDPTALTLNKGGAADALDRLLTLVRDPALSYSGDQLAKRDALSRFKTGQLGMILGYRDLTPVLRQQDGLSFGVMPLPRIGRSATVTDVQGFCVKPDLPHRTSTATLLAYLVSAASSTVLAETGYVVPANVNVLNSDAFLQPTQQPLGAQVFGAQIRFGIDLPTGERWAESVTPLTRALEGLFYDASDVPTADRLGEVDDTITPLLAPAPSSSPSGSATASPSASSTGSSSSSP